MLFKLTSQRCQGFPVGLCGALRGRDLGLQPGQLQTNCGGFVGGLLAGLARGVKLGLQPLACLVGLAACLVDLVAQLRCGFALPRGLCGGGPLRCLS